MSGSWRWLPLQRLAASEVEAGAGEHADLVRGALGREHAEGAREEVVAGRARGRRSVLRPGRRAATTHPRAVDQVVVDEGRHVHELDGDTGGDGWRGSRRRGEKREGRAEPLATGGERVGADVGDEAG